MCESGVRAHEAATEAPLAASSTSLQLRKYEGDETERNSVGSVCLLVQAIRLQSDPPGLDSALLGDVCYTYS